MLLDHSDSKAEERSSSLLVGQQKKKMTLEGEGAHLAYKQAWELGRAEFRSMQGCKIAKGIIVSCMVLVCFALVPLQLNPYAS